jgi:hypothetical protein
MGDDALVNKAAAIERAVRRVREEYVKAFDLARERLVVHPAACRILRRAERIRREHRAGCPCATGRANVVALLLNILDVDRQGLVKLVARLQARGTVWTLEEAASDDAATVKGLRLNSIERDPVGRGWDDLPVSLRLRAAVRVGIVDIERGACRVIPFRRLPPIRIPVPGGVPHKCRGASETATPSSLVEVARVAVRARTSQPACGRDRLRVAGFTVLLVNAHHVKNVPGRKSDVSDCEWLRDRHIVGLLRGSFRPTDGIVALRAYLRHRDTLIQTAGAHVQRMQKALVQMNVQLPLVVSDITGITGLRILRDIVAGRTDPHALAQHRDYRCHASEAEIVAALTGNYRPEHVFGLRQNLEAFDHVQQHSPRVTPRSTPTGRRSRPHHASTPAIASRPPPAEAARQRTSVRTSDAPPINSPAWTCRRSRASGLTRRCG